MAAIFITEYAEAVNIAGKLVPAGVEPAVAEQTVAITAGSLQSAAFNDKTTFVRVNVDGICHLKFGTNPTAVTTEKRIADESTEFFGVSPGQAIKVAVITGV